MISDRRLYLTADGKVVGEDDPRQAFLLVGAGGYLPDEDARRLGLLPTDETPEAKHVPGPEQTKAVVFPPETKRARRRNR